MSAQRYRSTTGSVGIVRAVRGPIVAAAAVGALLRPAAAEAQDLAYCDFAVESQQQVLRLQKNGNATTVTTGERKKQGIRLTDEKKNQRGTMFHRFPLRFKAGASFYQHFRVRISGGLLNSPPAGGDGLAFMIQNDVGDDPLMVGKIGEAEAALGAPGEGFGYSGITQSIALELDTSQNMTSSDPDGNHIALDIGGLMSHTTDGTPEGTPLMAQSVGSTVAPWQPVKLDPVMQSLESTSVGSDTRDVWIEYECSAADACSMKVYMTFNAGPFADPAKPGTLPQKPTEPVMVVDSLKDLKSYLNGSTGFAGFSGSTSNGADEQLVTFWILSQGPLEDSDMNNLEDRCECNSIPTACGGDVPICETLSDQGFCRDCLNDVECGSVNPGNPICDVIATGGTGACVECLTDAHCPSEEPYCNKAVRECTANCTTDAQCELAKWCDNPTGVEFGGTCLEDLPNGDPIPKSENHTPPLEGLCTADAAAVVCQSGTCDALDNLCGLPVGGPCDSDSGPIICRSGVCSETNVCACTSDTDCGNAASGHVCDAATGACLDGCRGAEGNGCPKGYTCSSETSAVGVCKPPPPVPPQGTQVSGGSVEGAGLFSCGAAGRGGSGGPAALMLFAALAGQLARRRRGR